MFRATGEQALLALARETHGRILERIARPGFNDTAPYRLPPGRKAHAVPMILLEVTNELAITTGDPELDAHCDRFATEIMTHFVRPDRGLLVEYLDSGFRELPPPEGTFVNPGHTIESMWFVLHWARRTARPEVIERAAEVIRRHLEAGWDPEYGGLFLGIDAEGGDPYLPHSEKKAWWPHTEALYALLLTHRLTGAAWARDWYERVHHWSWSHFHMPEVGEWRQRLDRSGKPIDEVIALPVKDPFHLPRSAVLIIQLLSNDKI
jgi:N-acylglucosamine 2-epimerase